MTAPSPRIQQPLVKRINPRLIAVLGVVFLLVSFGAYRFARAELSHGVEKDGSFYRVDLKKMGFFRFDEFTDGIDKVPPQFRALDGQEIALEGSAWSPNDAGNHAMKYQFVYSISQCCFKGPPLVQERVFATVRDPDAAPLRDGEFRIFGKLHINTRRDDIGKIEQLYQIDVERTEPL